MTLDYFYGQSGELFSYFRIPKALFQDRRFRQLSTDARTLYGILLDRMSLSVKNGWLDEQGRVYIIYTIREVQESLCCAEHKAVKLFRELEQLDLIERKRRGLGRPSLIYVKDFSSGLPKAQVQNCPNSNSGAAESAILEQPKPQANKTDKNKTEWNDPDPIYSEGIREQLEDYFSQSLEVDLLLRLCPDDEDTIYQIVDLLVDTCSTKRKMLRIAGDDKPAEVVRSRLKKLNADHIKFVLDSLAENTAPVRNMKQYLLAMLYNAPTTMNLYYERTTGRSQKSDVIAYQVRQSFKPGEVTPEEANRIGYEFAERFLKGKHAFIVATHTDRAHIHNHIIYNSTALDGTRKFKNFWLSTFAVQRLSDLICLEHQLSTIEYKP